MYCTNLTFCFWGKIDRFADPTLAPPLLNSQSLLKWSLLFLDFQPPPLPLSKHSHNAPFLFFLFVFLTFEGALHAVGKYLSMRSSLMWMRSSLMVRASDCQNRSRHSPGFDPGILRHSGTSGATDEAVLNTVHRKKIQKIPLFKYLSNVCENVFRFV